MSKTEKFNIQVKDSKDAKDAVRTAIIGLAKSQRVSVNKIAAKGVKLADSKDPRKGHLVIAEIVDDIEELDDVVDPVDEVDSFDEDVDLSLDEDIADSEDEILDVVRGLEDDIAAIADAVGADVDEDDVFDDEDFDDVPLEDDEDFGEPIEDEENDSQFFSSRTRRRREPTPRRRAASSPRRPSPKRARVRRRSRADSEIEFRSPVRDERGRKFSKEEVLRDARAQERRNPTLRNRGMKLARLGVDRDTREFVAVYAPGEKKVARRAPRKEVPTPRRRRRR